MHKLKYFLYAVIYIERVNVELFSKRISLNFVAGLVSVEMITRQQKI